MSDDPGNLTLVFLRRLDAKMDRLGEDLHDVKQRLTVLETQVGGLVATEQSHYAVTMQRLDRIERRLDLVDDPT